MQKKQWMGLVLLPCLAAAGNAWGQVFSLGEIKVTASPLAPSAPGSNVLEAEDIRLHDKESVGTALNMAAGVSLNKVGARNEEMVYVRGFDLRQVPVYMDGIPVYVPYDGYVDLGRFTTFDLSRIEVAKGFSSLTYGPNTLGGAINLVSRRPSKAFEGEVGAGVSFSDGGDNYGYRSYANLGSNQGNWYVQGGYSQLNEDYFPMAGSYGKSAGEDGGDRNNSYRKDSKLSLKLGLTPNASDEYAIGLVSQHGVKGTPPYAGNVAGVTPRYWRWPYWDKDSIYALSSTRIGEHTLKLRLYHDTYRNSLFAYDDATYTKQVKKSSFRSRYDDYTNGFSAEMDLALASNNRLKVAYHFKQDVHREMNEGEPMRHFKDRTQSLAFEDSHAFTSRLSLVTGISFERRDSLQAEDYNSTTKAVSDFRQKDNDAINGQAGLFYGVGDSGKLRLTLARKSRFPTIKDRYSYRMGTAIPNESLKMERADHLEVGYNDRLGSNWQYDLALFHSDITDMIQSVTIAPGACTTAPCSQMQNVGKVRAEGLEATLRGQVGNWDLSAAYTYLDRDNRSSSRVFLTDTPHHKLFSSAAWNAGPWSAVASAELASSRYSSSDGKQVAHGFGIANLKGGYRLGNGVLLEAGVRNLFDRLYEYSEGFPEAGRTYFLQANAPL